MLSSRQELTAAVLPTEEQAKIPAEMGEVLFRPQHILSGQLRAAGGGRIVVFEDMSTGRLSSSIGQLWMAPDQSSVPEIFNDEDLW